MISETCFSPEWLTRIREEHGYNDVGLAEKAIRAFELLVQLRRTNLPFVFKGGTCLLLHLPEIQRLSIDIDIVVTDSDDEKISEAVESIANSPRFNRSEPDERGVRGLPHRDHYKFFYDSAPSNREDYVLLDVVKEPDWDLKSEERPVNMAFLEMEEEVSVRVPTIESLVGDKLTAFAPNTLGVPFKSKKGNGQEMQVAKQLFDVGSLTGYISDWGLFQNAYNRNYEMENSYHVDQGYSRDEVLRDSIDTSLDLCGVSIGGYKERGTDAESMIQGIKKLRSHLVSAKFTVAREAKTAAAKVFMLANTLQRQDELNVELLQYSEEKHADWVNEVVFEPPLTSLEKIRLVEPEAVYYLALGSGLLPPV